MATGRRTRSAPPSSRLRARRPGSVRNGWIRDMSPQVARGEAESSGNGNGRGSTEHLLALRGFSKSFGPVRALHNVDFEVDSGEIVALVGDNGAGKSTLIKAIDGVQPPDSGEAYFDGKQVRISSPQVAENLGIATV